MTTKDYIYLGLIVLTALAFYCNGFYAGVHRCKRMYDPPADEAESGGETTLGSLQLQGDKLLVQDEKILGDSVNLRDQKLLVPKIDWRGNFGNN